MDEKEVKNKNQISRRNLLKGAGLVVGGAALSTTLPSLATDAFAKATAKATSCGEPVFEVYDTDVLVIGSGLAGINAALTSFAEGANVLIADKGPFKASGGGGMNWGIIVRFLINNPQITYDFAINASYGLVNQKLCRKIVDNWMDLKMEQYLVNRGMTTFFRNPDGTMYIQEKPVGGAKVLYNYFCRHDQDEIVKQGIKVVDRTMITDLFVQDGKCIGAMGLNITTGTFRVFRAKAVIGCGGPAPWNYGWISVAPVSINSPDNTGDLDAIAYNHGCRLIDMEFVENDAMNIYPEGLAATCNGGFAADALEYRYLCDKDGVYWLRDIPMSKMNRGRFSQEIAKRVLEGKGSPNGGVYLDLRDPKAYQSLFEREVYSRNIKPYKERFDIDVKGMMLEVALEQYESEGHPVIDENCATEIPGLYFGVGGGTRGARFPSTSGGTINGAIIAARNAVKYAQNAPKIKKINWKPVHDEFNRIHALRSRKVAKPLAPHEVRHSMQRACFKALGPIKNGKLLAEAIKELERIKKYDLPRMALRDDSKQYNTEWQQAIENYFMMDVSLANCKSSLFREESRGTHFRTDFPKMDNDKWLCNIAVKKVNDKMVAEKRPIVWSEYPPAKVKEMLEQGLK